MKVFPKRGSASSTCPCFVVVMWFGTCYVPQAYLCLVKRKKDLCGQPVQSLSFPASHLTKPLTALTGAYLRCYFERAESLQVSSGQLVTLAQIIRFGGNPPMT